jgi:uncharacterized BrkB/YihY/UPF0761 family membrane protein
MPPPLSSTADPHLVVAALLILLVIARSHFTVLENAMSVIFHHRVRIRRRHFLALAVLPYLFVVLLGIGFLIVTLVSGALEALGRREVALFGAEHSLQPVAAAALYAVGVVGEIAMLTAILGGVTAGALWEISRHVLVWY